MCIRDRRVLDRRAGDLVGSVGMLCAAAAIVVENIALGQLFDQHAVAGPSFDGALADNVEAALLLAGWGKDAAAPQVTNHKPCLLYTSRCV